MGADTIVHLGRAYVHTHTYATVCRRTFSSACSNIGERSVCGSLYIQNVDVALSLARAAAVDVAPSQALAMTDCYKALAHAKDHFVSPGIRACYTIGVIILLLGTIV